MMRPGARLVSAGLLAFAAVTGASSAWADDRQAAGARADDAAAPEAGVRGSFGDRGDLTGRFGVRGGGAYAPEAMLELSGDAGENLALLGFGSAYFRAQPEIVLSFLAARDVRVMGGGGVGSAYVFPVLCADRLESRCAAGAADVRPTVSTSVGASLSGHGRPTVHASVQTDAVAAHGFTTMLVFALAPSE